MSKRSNEIMKNLWKIMIIMKKYYRYPTIPTETFFKEINVLNIKNVYFKISNKTYMKKKTQIIVFFESQC